MGGDADAKTADLDRGRAARRPAQLVVLEGDEARAYPLPASGRLVIGRAEDADVRVDHPSISRRHALVHLGATLELEDLGSSNGTQVRGRALARGERVAVQAGDLVEIGDVLCVVTGPVATARPRRLASHAYFIARLEEECGRGRPFTVARLHVERPGPELERQLLEALRPGDVAAGYGPDEYEIILGDVAADAAGPLLAALRGQLAAGATRCGDAAFPAAGRSPDALLAAACAAVRGPAGPEGGGLVVADEGMAQLHRALERIAVGNIYVLLLGETGVGKEIFAARLHARSRRAAGPFVTLNCAAFTEALLESELFGHERGAFSGAHRAKDGLLAAAAGGTVFFDEVGDLPLALQAKLLRVLEEQRVRRVGGLKPLPIDVRFVSATNRDLAAEVAAGRFRSDLFYRLNGFTLMIPPLRARPAEIAPLAQHFVAVASRQAELTRPPPIAADALAMLERHAWPGNVRELRNVMERAVLLSAGAEITAAHLPLAPPAVLPGDDDGDGERARLVQALAESLGNQTRAAELLGISRRTLINRIEKYDLPRPRKGQKP